MSGLIDEVLGQLQGPAMGQLAQKLGADEGATSKAVSAALPMLVGALGRNAQAPEGAASLLAAVQKDHQGGLGDVLGGLLGQSGGAGGGLAGMLGGVLGGASAPAADGASILGHVFGGAQDAAAANLGQATGLDQGQAGKLLQFLAPLVMSAIGKLVAGGKLDAAGLGQALGPQAQPGGLAGQLLDSALGQGGSAGGLGDVLKTGLGLLGGK